MLGQEVCTIGGASARSVIEITGDDFIEPLFAFKITITAQGSLALRWQRVRDFIRLPSCGVHGSHRSQESGVRSQESGVRSRSQYQQLDACGILSPDP